MIIRQELGQTEVAPGTDRPPAVPITFGSLGGITIKTYDAVVIGGGVIGNCVTYYLSKAGLKVALVEREDIASGTTGKSDGNVLIADKQPGYATELAFASQQLFKELASELSEDFSYTQQGSLYVLESEDELAVAEDYVRQQAEDAIL